MRNFINITETMEAGFVSIASLPSRDTRVRCCAAFNQLADLQRGKPERLGGGEMGNPHLFPNGTGLYTQATEHMGDLTNRMAADWATGEEGEGDYGYDYVRQKVSRAIRYLNNRYGFEREIREQVQRNYEYFRKEKNEHVSLDVWWADLEEAGIRYAEAHAELPVYNDAQWTAREIAISIGRMDFNAYAIFLNRIDAHLTSEKNWIAYASLVRLGEDGQPLLFRNG